METSRGTENRNNNAPKISTGERGRSQPLNGFEGMNYEQKRRPYKNTSDVKKDQKETTQNRRVQE